MALVAVFFVFVAQLRSQYGTNSIKGMTSRQIVLMPYKYIANNYWNLDYAINPPTDRTIHPFTMGIDALYGMFEYTRLPMAIRDMMGWDNIFNESVQKVPGLNTTGYLWEAYKDWGVIGTVWFPFVVSFFMCFLYERMHRYATPRNIIFYSMFLYYIGWWWFVAGYKFGLFWLWVYFIFIATKLCETKVVHHEK
jgi:oligosaccharide repeat unit polymerase